MKLHLTDKQANSEGQAIKHAFPWQTGKPKRYVKVRKLANPVKPRNKKAKDFTTKTYTYNKNRTKLNNLLTFTLR